MSSDRPVIIARSVHGLEWVCASEVSALASADALALALGPGRACAAAPVPDDMELDRRQVTFSVASVCPALLNLRTADDVFLRLGVVDGVGTAREGLPALGRAVTALDWRFAVQALRGVRVVPERVAFDVVASLEGGRNYNRFAVERCVGSALSSVLGWSFAERDAGGRAGPDTDLTVRVFIRGERATFAVRLARKPLHRREYKASTGRGTLHPPVAAALAALAAPAAGLLVDPFCGDGTIAIEAALARPGLRVAACDIDPVRAGNARLNASRAGVDIDVSVADAADLAVSPGGVDAIVTNPPWNLAVDLGGRLRRPDDPFWDGLPAMLRPTGVLCCLVSADQDIPPLAGGPGQAASGRWVIGLRQQVRLAGRVAIVLLAAPPGADTPTVPAELAHWRDRALAEGIVTETGF